MTDEREMPEGWRITTLPEGWTLDPRVPGRIRGPGGVTCEYDGERLKGSVLGVTWSVPNAAVTACFALHYGSPCTMLVATDRGGQDQHEIARAERARRAKP